jgi:cupin superfamily acireductone dioxygenase involved in methionine salvage
MSTNYPSTSESNAEPKKDNKGVIILILVVAIIASWAYFFYTKNQNENLITEKDATYLTLDSSKNEVQKEYDSAMVRLEAMTQANNGLDSLVKSKDQEMQILKSRFRAIVSKQNASARDLAEARSLVKELNVKIDDYVKEIERLQAENQQLTVDKANLTSDKQNLEKNLSTTLAAKKDAEDKVDVGSTLHASSFKISAINERNSGKESETTRAKRADKLRISFVLDENRIAISGSKILYIIAKDPAGKVIREATLDSGTFGTRQDGNLEYTNKLDVQYIQGEIKQISFDLKQTDKYEKGSYNFIVYQNGFKIGEGVAMLK